MLATFTPSINSPGKTETAGLTVCEVVSVCVACTGGNDPDQDTKLETMEAIASGDTPGDGDGE